MFESSREFEATLIRPEQEQPDYGDVVGVYVPGIDANINNTGDRVQELASRVGVPFVLSDLLQQNRREVFGMPNREANQPMGEIFEAMSVRRAAFVREFIDSHQLERSKVVVMADSLAVPAVEGMQLHADHKFDGLVLRDGWNLGKSESAKRGYVRYGLYQVKNIAHDLYQKIRGTGRGAVPEHGFKQIELPQSETSLFAKIRNVADLMRSHETKQNAYRIARMGGFALHIVGLQPGLSGNKKQTEQFMKHTRDAAALARRPLHMRAAISPGWHSDLLDPERGARDFINTLELLED